MPRLFVALRPPEPVRDALFDLMGGVEGARWQSDDQLHLTLRFVGDIPPPDAEDLAAELGRVLAVLANALAREPDDLSGAMRRYERARQRRTARVQRAARRNGRIYHLSGAMAAARNLVLRSTPPQRLMASYDWLYGWKPPTLG